MIQLYNPVSSGTWLRMIGFWVAIDEKGQRIEYNWRHKPYQLRRQGYDTAAEIEENGIPSFGFICPEIAAGGYQLYT